MAMATKANRSPTFAQGAALRAAARVARTSAACPTCHRGGSAKAPRLQAPQRGG
jgi:hypothetical protein